MDLSEWVMFTTIQDIKDLADEEERNAKLTTIQCDRMCSYFVRHKTRGDVKDILDEVEVAAYETEYCVIDQPQKNGKGSWGTYVLLDSDKHTDIEAALWDYDNTVLEGSFSTYAATLARLQAG